MALAHPSDSVHWYISGLTSRVVARSGIPGDRFHIGKLILQSFKDDPDFIAQIDGGTGASETNGSILKRSIQCATGFKKLGLKHGDVMVIMASNNLDLAVAIYAAMYLGVTIAPIDRTMKSGELLYTFEMYKPTIIMCHSEYIPNVESTLMSLGQTVKIVTFDGLSNGSGLADLQTDNEEVDNFMPTDFDSEDSIAVILPTSGSTGLPKGAALSYKACMITGAHLWVRYMNFPTPSKMWLILSPIQWLTALVQFITSPIIKFTRLQTTKPVTVEHTRHLINIYRPTITALSSTMMTQLLKMGEDGLCDLTCFDTVYIGGSVVHNEIIQEIKKATPRTTVINAYGLTELCGLAFQGECPPGSSGKPTGIYRYKLVDINTEMDIQKANVNGELWIKGPGMFKEYYNNPEETQQAFAEDGWFKTGDLFYRDEHWNYYFVERIKMLLKYKHFQIAPAEIEAVIREHPGVMDVAVTSIPDLLSGDLPVGCVILKSGYSITGQEIKDLVAEKLSDYKQLRGGVAFMSSFPVTATTKIDRMKLKDMVREMLIKPM